MAPAQLAQLLERGEPEGAAAWGEGDRGEGLPEVFAEGGGDGLLAVEGELAEGCVGLGGVSLCA